MAALSDDAITQELAKMPGWSHEGGELTRQFRFKDFVEAFGLISQVATVQEKMDHHATITNTWADVKFSLSTHSEGGITEKDFALARAIDERATAAARA